MAKSILIGPVPGLPAADSIEFIIMEILDRIPDSVRLYMELADGFAKNERKGLMLVHVKLHLEEEIDDLFIPLAHRCREVSTDFNHLIRCVVVKRRFGPGGESDGDVPCPTTVGPPKGPPMLFEHEPQPEPEVTARTELGHRSADWWKAPDSRTQPI